MKRLLLVCAGALALAGCGGGGTAAPVGANSTDSTPVTAEGNVISTDTSPVSTPDAVPGADVPTPVPTPTDTATESTDGNESVAR